MQNLEVNIHQNIFTKLTNDMESKSKKHYSQMYPHGSVMICSPQNRLAKSIDNKQKDQGRRNFMDSWPGNPIFSAKNIPSGRKVLLKNLKYFPLLGTLRFKNIRSAKSCLPSLTRYLQPFISDFSG